MNQENTVILYEGIQRIYRNAVVRYLRVTMTDAYKDDAKEKLHGPFKKEEWDKIVENSQEARKSGELTTPIIDDFDLLSVNHFFNLFDSYYDVLLKVDTGRRGKQAFLNWMREIKVLRDPLSHPPENDFYFEDAFRLLDCSKRVLLKLNLEEDAEKVKNLMDKLLSRNLNLELHQEPLEDRLPPRESIVVKFSGREKEMQELWEWFNDPVSRRWALAGEGGKGKTALAYNFAFEVKMKAPPPYQVILWLSAKKRRFLEGRVVHIQEPDFFDLDSALRSLLTQYGWLDEIGLPVETKRKRLLELFNGFPALIVVDDVDSLASEAEDVDEFFGLHVPATASKVLFTSRRTIFGMGKSTTHVSGFTEGDAEPFFLSRCELLELDANLFGKTVMKQILNVTEGSPLYIEDLMRLTASVKSVQDAISAWEGKGGDEARRYALGRECDLLTQNAKQVLFAACVCPGRASFAEIEQITGFSTEIINAALKELQSIFLVMKPKLVEGEQRFEVNVNTKALLREVYGASDQFRRIEEAHQAISGEMEMMGSGDVGAIIRQAILFLKSQKYGESEDLLKNAISKYQAHPDLFGVLGFVYKSWLPPRVTDARENFKRASQLNCKNSEMYEHWAKLEMREQEWTKAAEAVDKGLKKFPDNKILLYLGGYARSRLAKDLSRGLHFEKEEKELYEAGRLLKAALKAKSEIRGKGLDADIYRAMVLNIEQSIENLRRRKERLEPKSEPNIDPLINEMKSYFKLWRGEYPADPNVTSEWERIRNRYLL